MNSGGAVRMAVVGLGLMGQRHCRVLAATPGARLVGVLDSSTELAREVATPYGAVALESFEQVLGAEDVDAVVLCLPSGLHAEFGLRAARARKHVIVEKPLDSRVDRAEELVRECMQRGVLCAVISQYRYGPGLQALKWAVDSGALGQLVLVRAAVKWFRHDAYYTESQWRGRIAGENGGVLINQAVHAIDALQWLFGEPDRVACMTARSRPQVMETEDTAGALLQWESGLVGVLEATTSAAPGHGEIYEINSPQGVLRVNHSRVLEWWHRDGMELPAHLTAEAQADSGGIPPADGAALDPKLQLFARQYQNIVAAVRGEAPLDVTATQALAVVRTIQRLYNVSHQIN